MKKAEQKTVALAVALTSTASLTVLTQALFREGQVFGGHATLGLWITIFRITCTVVLAAMVGLAISKQRTS